MAKTIKYVIVIVLFLLYIYNVTLKILPISFRQILFVIGVVYYTCQHSENRIIFSNRFLIRAFGAISLGFFVFGIHLLFTIESDLIYFQIMASYFALFFDAYFLVCLVRKGRTKDELFKDVLNVLLLAIVINNTIAMSQMFIPSMYERIMTLQVFNEAAYNTMFNSHNTLMRLAGLGENMNFGGGAICALGVMIGLYRFFNSRSYLRFFYMLMVISIFLSGLFIARTVLMGFVSALPFIIYYVGYKHFLKYLLYLGVFVFVLSVIFNTLLKYADSDVASRAFELWFNFIDSGKATSNSTDELLEMYKIIPNSVQTWIIGDGYFAMGIGYYMNTDIGFFRLIYYLGILGCFSIFYFHYLLIRVRKSSINDIFYLSLFFWFVLMNVKGFFIPTSIFMLFFVVEHFKYKKIIL